MIQWRFEADGGGEIYSAALASSSGEKTRTPPYGRGVGGRCIIDEALYRQTKLNTEALAAPPRRTLLVGGWVRGCGGGREHRDLLFSPLCYCVCREETESQSGGLSNDVPAKLINSRRGSKDGEPIQSVILMQQKEGSRNK